MKRPIFNQSQRQDIINNRSNAPSLIFDLRYRQFKRDLKKSSWIFWAAFVLKYEVLRHPIGNVSMNLKQ